jgi:hypothetical protein
MMARWILSLSLAGNVMLAVVLLFPRPTERPEQPVEHRYTRWVTNRVDRRIDPDSSRPKGTGFPLPFFWSQIQSGDSQVFIANLRAVGCPEQTIHAIIAGQLNDYYDARTRAVYAAVSQNFWDYATDGIWPRLDAADAAVDQLEHEKLASFEIYFPDAEDGPFLLGIGNPGWRGVEMGGKIAGAKTSVSDSERRARLQAFLDIPGGVSFSEDLLWQRIGDHFQIGRGRLAQASQILKAAGREATRVKTEYPDPAEQVTVLENLDNATLADLRAVLGESATTTFLRYGVIENEAIQSPSASAK